MRIEEVVIVATPYIKKKITEFEINIVLFNNVSDITSYNKKIRSLVASKYGVYIWVNSKTNEIVYIGMAGKVKTNGTFAKHTLKDRLTAPRGKDKTTKKDISTKDYIHNFMKSENISSLNFYILYSKNGVPPTFIESLILYEYYKLENKLPQLNNAF